VSPSEAIDNPPGPHRKATFIPIIEHAKGDMPGVCRAGEYHTIESSSLRPDKSSPHPDGGTPSLLLNRFTCRNYRDCSRVQTSRAEARPSRFAGLATIMIAPTLEGRPPGRLVGIIEIIRGLRQVAQERDPPDSRG
jgi:hypothetical protein